MKKFLPLSSAIFIASFLLLASVHYLSRASATDLPAPTPQPPAFRHERLHPSLLKTLAQASGNEPLPIIIEWAAEPYDQVLLSALPALYTAQAAQGEQRLQIINVLKSYAAEQSKALQITLSNAERLGQVSDIRSYWVSPIIAARASPAFIEALSQREDVLQVRLDERIYLEQTVFTSQEADAGLSWDLDLIGVNLAQEQLGLDGTGVVVANLDTGVDWQHPALLKKYRGYNPNGPAQHLGNWFVATDEPYLVPGDGDGHGTHTMGTMVGDDGAGNRIGVAPGARWIAVKVFNNQGYTYESWVHEAFQWVIAPQGNPSLAPDIVNCSWGTTDSADERFHADIIALRSAGILPVFSAGNEGPSPATIGSPASFPESFAVGAVDQEKILAFFSSRGPSPWDEIKPDITAPGVNIRSAYPGSGYTLASGTSMAAPHVAGVAALILQGNPALTPDELEDILRTTAQPLGAVVPNNDSGWGLVNAFAAGLQATSHGGLSGSVKGAGTFNPVGYPILLAVPLANPAQTLTFAGDVNGSYSLALQPGNYDLTVSAFGYLSSTLHNILVLTSTQTTLDIYLAAAPSGHLAGRITDLSSGAPVSATLTIAGTPVRTQSDPGTGLYVLDLPQGTWPLRFYASTHRTGHLTPTLTAGQNYTLNLGLLPAPQVLLVDAGRWYYDSQIAYFRDALSALDYPYRELPIRTIGLGGSPDERPLPGDFDAYDIVIWSDPSTSPGWIGTGEVISGFLRTGGNLLLSGEDILFLDGGGSLWTNPEPYLVGDIGIQFKAEGNPSPLEGVPGSFWKNIQLSLNTPDSAQQQDSPDQAFIRSPLSAQPALRWAGQAIGGVASGVCQPHRAFWTGFGLEGAGPRSSRVDLLGKIMQWFELPAKSYGISALPSNTLLLGSPGSVLTQTIQLNSTGVLTDVYRIHVNGGAWSFDLRLPDGSLAQENASLSLGACQQAAITLAITIPPDQPRDARSSYALSFISQSDPAISDTITITAKTYAPVLLVEHQAWYQDIQPYTQTLTSLGIPYDIFHTLPTLKSPPADTLAHYPMVIWTTGYNWYNPLDAASATILTQYLDQGGRLLISSQDLLDTGGQTAFAKDRLGVLGYTLSVTPTEVTSPAFQPASGTPTVWDDLGLWELAFTYTNWGDAIIPSEDTLVILEDQNPYPVGVASAGDNWRSSFFSFPLENLELPAHHLLLSRALLWISPFGNSALQAPPAALSGAQIPITLTLQLANDQPIPGLRAALPLLPQITLLPGSLEGGWELDLPNNRLVWSGDLAPAEKLTLRAVLQIAPDLPAQAVLPLKAYLQDRQGLVAVAEAPVHIGVPWLRLRGQVTPQIVHSRETSAYTITLKNDGVITSLASMTVTIPAGLRLITNTLTAASGNLSASPGIIYWSGQLTPQADTILRYRAQIIEEKPGRRLATMVEAVGAFLRRKAWLPVLVPSLNYFPFIEK